MSTSKRARWSSTWRLCTPGSSVEAGRRAAPSRPSIDVRVRWRSSESVPVSTVLPGADDRHAVAQLLDLGEDVAREQHRPAGLARLLDAGLEDRLLQRVEARGRLVEHEQLGVGRERGDERDLLPVALRVGAALLRRVELEALEQLRAPRAGRARRAGGRAGRSPRRRSASATGSRRRGRRRAGGAARRRRATGRRRAAATSPASARSRPSRTRIVVDLPAPFGPEEPVDLARRDVEVEPVERAEVAERLDQAGDLDRVRHGFSLQLVQNCETANRIGSAEFCWMDGRRRGRARFVERFALLLSEAGMPRMPARVFAAILAEDAGRLTAARPRRAARRQPRRRLRGGPLPHPGRHARPRPRARRAPRPLPAPRRRLVRDLRLPRRAAALGAGDGDEVALLGPGRPAGRRLEETREFFAFLQRSSRRDGPLAGAAGRRANGAAAAGLHARRSWRPWPCPSAARSEPGARRSPRRRAPRAAAAPAARSPRNSARTRRAR